MKANQSILLTICGIVLLSCSNPRTNPELNSHEKEIELQNTNDSELSKEEKRKKVEEEDKLDSLRLEGVLNQAIQLVQTKSHNTSFVDSFQTFPDSIYKVDVKIDYDFHFSNGKRHLIIHRYSPVFVQIDVFSHTKDGLKNILSHKQWAMEHIDDTIKDVNGDGLNDIVVNCYGVSGCCLKAFSEVYLSRSDLQSFSNMNHFINPTFSSKEGIIRGVCYGHPGETELYKYKWNGEHVDTIEYVSFETNDDGKRTGKVIISNQYPNHKNYKVIRKLRNVPSDYKSIEGYFWFAGEL